MKKVSGILSLSILSLGIAAHGVSAQESALYPDAGQQALSPFGAGMGRGIEKESAATIEAQQSCPQPYGDAWDTTSEQVWNTLEFGIQVKPQQKPTPKMQFYTRYTCARPLERPITSR